jgi:hypothetical protein
MLALRHRYNADGSTRFRLGRFPVLRAAGLLALAALVLVTGCGARRVVLPIAIDHDALVVPKDARGLTSDEAALRAIAAIAHHDLGLPIPDRLTVYVYGSRHAFEQGLIHDGKVSPRRAAELAEFAIGVGRRRQLLLNDEGADPSRREWLRLMAHELVHVSQIELAQGEGRAAQWIAEGMAEWIAFTVLERLGLGPVEQRRVFARLGIRNHAALVAARLDLETLGSPHGFTARHRREGSVPTYQLAFLMTDYLIERHGFDRMLDYFRLFAKSQRPREHFQHAFGQTIEEFEVEILAHLKAVLP